jgi:flagellin-like hook-associated protein FlgL
MFPHRESIMNAIAPTPPLMSSQAAANRLAGMYGGTASGNPADAISAGVIDSELAQIDGQLDVATLLDTQSTTADSVLGSITDLLNDASTLVIASAGNTISDAEKQANQTQMDSILDTINRLGSNPNINSNAWIKLGDLTADDIGTISIGSEDFLLSDVGSGQPLNLLNGNLNGAALSIDQAINDISDMREEIGSASQGSEAEQYILMNSEIELTAGLSTLGNLSDAMASSRQVRSMMLTTGYAANSPGGILSLLA